MTPSSTLLALLVITVAVSAKAGTGTGFAVTQDTIVTNQHVVDGCRLVTVESLDGNRTGEVVSSDPLLDLAIIRVPGMTSNQVATIRKEAPKIGEGAFVFGYPLMGTLSDDGNFTNGVVSATRGLGNSANEFQLTAAVQPGNSGGPVLDKSGNIIGVVVSKLDAVKMIKRTGDIPQNVNFAVKNGVLLSFLQREQALHKISSKAAERELSTKDIAEVGKLISHKIICNNPTISAQAAADKPPIAVEPPIAPEPPIANRTDTSESVIACVRKVSLPGAFYHQNSKMYEISNLLKEGPNCASDYRPAELALVGFHVAPKGILEAIRRLKRFKPIEISAEARGLGVFAQYEIDGFYVLSITGISKPSHAHLFRFAQQSVNTEVQFSGKDSIQSPLQEVNKVGFTFSQRRLGSDKNLSRTFYYVESNDSHLYFIFSSFDNVHESLKAKFATDMSIIMKSIRGD